MILVVSQSLLNQTVDAMNFEGLTPEQLTAEERLIAEQAVLNLRTLNKAHHGRKARLVMTTAGELKLSCIYFRCVKCGV